jgi:hypothetical protein
VHAIEQSCFISIIDSLAGARQADERATRDSTTADTLAMWKGRGAILYRAPHEEIDAFGGLRD